VPNIFNPLSFFRHVPNPLLERFFSSVPAFAGFDWSTVTERRIDPILERCNAIPPAECARIFRIFRTVESLANPIGTQVLIEAAHDVDLDIAEAIAAKRNAHERALWCYMQDKRIVEGARTLAHIENLPRRSCETLKNLPMKSVHVTPEMLAEFGRVLSEFFWSTQARGDKCKVDHRRREGDIDCFFAYPADYVDERFGYDDDGQLEFRSWNPAFELVFGYHRTDGTTDIYAQGGRKIRESLSQIFARVILGAELVSDPLEQDCFNLEVFKNPNITFPTDQADNITLVRVLAMRLKFHGRRGGRVSVALDDKSKDRSLYEVIADLLAEKHARLTDATILGVTLQAFLRGVNARETSLTFKITAPAFCDLEDSLEEQMLRRYSKIWKIEKNADDLATAG
jgi:hypothetical protein